MRNDSKLSVKTSTGKSLFLFGYDMTMKPSGEELVAYCEFLRCCTTVLNEFGIHIGTNGYSYLIEAIKIIIDRERYDVRMKTDVYPLIAAKQGIRRNDPIEHSIRNAITTAYNDNLKSPGCNRMSIFVKKPTNKNFIIFASDEVFRTLCSNMLEWAS